MTFTVPGNKICWCVIVQLGLTEIADEQFRSSDWVPQQNQKMMDLIRHFKTTYGTMGDLFDATPVERISKVYFEDMLFETWNHGRTVLIGDGMCCICWCFFSSLSAVAMFLLAYLKLTHPIRCLPLSLPTLSCSQGENNINGCSYLSTLGLLLFSNKISFVFLPLPSYFQVVVLEQSMQCKTP